MKPYKDDIVISGIGGYFPKSLNVGEFKNNLFSNEILLGTKWSDDCGVSNSFGCIPWERFDNSYFGIHRMQTLFMDPLHRLALERTFEALLDAGVNPSSVRGKKIGCYMGMCIGENDNLFLESVVSGFGVTGHSRAMLPNRVSYWLNLKGPSVAYDCNWMTGFEVIRLAYEAIRNGECEGAVVGASNVAFIPEFQKLYEDMGLLSPDGSTKAFDAQANGYARADGCVVLFIQKAHEAKRSYGTIMHVDTKFDGTSGDELLTINKDNMISFMQEFYSKCPVEPDEIDYVETYGCAIKEIDKSELDALEEIYCKNRTVPLLIGSVKTQTGHSETCAALFSLVKVLLSMEANMLPATLQYQTPNPGIRGLTNGSFEVVADNRKWNSAYAAVNAVGICNYYGHIVIRRNPKDKALSPVDIPVLLPVSTRNEEAVTNILAKLAQKPNDPEFQKLTQDIFSKPIPLHMYRGYGITGEQFKQEFSHYNGTKRQVWFVYSGMGSQWCGMASDLMKFPIFAESISRSHEVLSSRGVDLMQIITTTDKSIFDNILNCFVGIAAIQVALTDLLNALGIVPDGIIGHSVGELGCAYADGCMTAEQMVLSAYSRGRASLEVDLIKGMMAAVGLGYSEMKDKVPESIEVACHNGPESCTISGPVEDMEKYVQELQDKKIFAKLVNVANIAYHSRYIKPAAPLLLNYLKEVLPGPVIRSSKWISTSNQASNWNTDLAKFSSPEYHTNNLLNSVLFEEGCKHIPKDAILIEIAPHGLLQAILKRSIKNATNIPLTSRNSASGAEFFLQSLGKLYLAGLDFDVSNIYPPVEYPVSRGTPTTSDLVGWNHTDIWEVTIRNEERLGYAKIMQNYQIDLSSEKYQECVGHKIMDNILMPTTFYLDIVCQILAVTEEVTFNNLEFKQHLYLQSTSNVPLHVVIQNGTGEFEFWSAGNLLLTGQITFPENPESFMLKTEPVEVSDANVQLSRMDFYRELEHRGYTFSGPFQDIRSVVIGENGSISVASWNKKWTYLVEAMIQLQYLTSGEQYQDAKVPKTIRQICVAPKSLDSEGSEVQFDYNYATKIISAKGCQVVDMTMTTLEIEKEEICLNSIDYIPLNNVSFNKMEGGFEFAIKLTLGNFDEPTVNTIFVSDIGAENSASECLENAIKACPHLQINLCKVVDPKDIYIQQIYPQLLIVNGTATGEIFRLVSSSNAFLLTKAIQCESSYEGVIEVAQFEMNGENYSIFRRFSDAEILTVRVNEASLSIKDLESPSTRWITDLRSAISRSKGEQIYLISSVMPQDGYKMFVETVRRTEDLQGVHFLFVIGGEAIDLTPVFKKNFIVTIVKNGVIHTDVPFSFAYRNDAVLNSSGGGGGTVQNRAIKFIGLNLKDETLNEEFSKRNEVGNIDYSGTTITGKRVMGLAEINKDVCQLTLDSIFSWEIPDAWSLEEAVTIPHAYVSAYYMMMIKANLQKGQTVLIHAGCSPIGLAAISIAAFNRCQIYTTVTTRQQKHFLIRAFFNLDEKNIFFSNDSSFHTDLMLATGGRGAHLVLNCLSGDLLQTSFDCCAAFGNLVHYGKNDFENSSSIGMFRFLLNNTVYLVDLENILKQTRQIKEKLWKMVADGIETCVVRPLVEDCTKERNFSLILRKLKNRSNIGKIVIDVSDSLPLHKLDMQKSNKFLCNSRHCYLIYGGSAAKWINVAEWLVQHGAKNIIISSSSKLTRNDINRRLSLLQTYFESNIITTSTKPNTLSRATDLLNECQMFGNIHSVFLLPHEMEDVRSNYLGDIEYLDQALRIIAPKALFVNFVDPASTICQLRAEGGFKAFHVELSGAKELKEGLDALDEILNSTSVYTVLQKRLKRNNPTIEVGKLLPTVEDIVITQKETLAEPKFVQILTKGPTDIREQAPLFIIIGITGHAEVKKMADRLLYPTYVASMPSTCWSSMELAKIYAKKIQEIYPKNVYNLVSVSTGGALTIEIARHLKQEKPEAQLNMFFIDSAPTFIQNVLVQLGESNKDLEMNILRSIFNINDLKILKELEAASNWIDRIQHAMEQSKVPASDRVDLENGLSRLKQMVEHTRNFQPDNSLISGKIHLILPSNMSERDSCGLSSYFKQPPQIKLIEGDHLSIICHPDTTNYINFSVDV